MFYFAPKRGYVVVNIDYRLAPQAKKKEIYQDVEDCAKWCRQVLPTELGDGVVDPEKLIMGGGSCG
jgi:acetyl esterase/lipase